MMLDRNALPPEHYLVEVATRAGVKRRADPAKIESLLALAPGVRISSAARADSAS